MPLYRNIKQHQSHPCGTEHFQSLIRMRMLCRAIESQSFRQPHLFCDGRAVNDWIGVFLFQMVMEEEHFVRHRYHCVSLFKKVPVWSGHSVIDAAITVYSKTLSAPIFSSSENPRASAVENITFENLLGVYR